jgi:tetratricopeptide (TPR) repeat protein
MSRRWSARLVGAALAVLAVGPPAVAVAQTSPPLLPLVPPPPDLTGLVPFTAAPLDKPPVPLPAVAPPEVPEGLPPLPAATIVFPADRPTTAVPMLRTLPCVFAVLRIPSESLECGLARYSRGEYEEAARFLEVATKGEGDVQREGRYWLGETYWRLGRIEAADSQFEQVARERWRDELTVWAQHASGWTAMRMGDFQRARDTFARLVTVALPIPMDTWARHGLGLSLYALRRYEEAQQTWSDLAARGNTRAPALARDVFFWHGETLGRVGQYGRAAAELGKFVRGGNHPMLETGLVRMGWWALLGQLYPDSSAAFRQYFAETQREARRDAGPAAERDWAEGGLALALVRTGNLEGARTAARPLQARPSQLTTPVLMHLAATALEKKKYADVHAVVQDLLTARLDAKTRAWALVVKGDASRLEGNRDDARTQYQLARSADPASPVGAYAAFRLAQTNFELREFAQTVTDLSEVLAGGLPPALRAPALLLQAEAAYAAGNQSVADAAYRRLLLEFPTHPHAPLVQYSLGWVALRRREADDARQRFTEFAHAHPTHGSAADALVLASELALNASELDRARQLLDEVIAQYPLHNRTEFARLNRGILMVRGGNIAGAQQEIGGWLSRNPSQPLAGRARAALGTAFLASGRAAEASREFTHAQSEGVGAFASLGLASAAMVQGRWTEATRDFTEARDSGTAPIARLAEYGLAAAALQRGSAAAFKKAGQAAFDAAPAGPMAPGLLYVLTGVAANEQDWPRAMGTARRLVANFPNAETADDALERIGAGAAKVRDWPAVLEAYQLMRQHYPQSPFVERARVAFAEALLETGRPDDARRELESAIDTLAAPGRGHALLLLARARQARGDRAGALEAYNRASRESRGADWSPELLMGHARLLIEDRRWQQARGVLDRLVKSDDQPTVLAALRAVGQTYQGEGDYMGAAEYYMTAAYLAPESSEGRRSMLSAAQNFAALKQPALAATVYRKLLMQPDLPSDVHSAAQQGLAAIGR